MKALTSLAVALTFLLAPSTGVAQTKLPVGESRGVRVVREHRAVVIVFTARAAKLHRRVAGKRVVVSCTTLLEDGTNTGSQVLRVPRHGRKLFTGDLTPNIDYCRVWRPRRRHTPKRPLVSVPLTQKGAVFLDEESKTRSLLTMLAIASVAKDKQKLDGYPTYDQLLKVVPQRARAAFAKKVVALAAPGDAPPARTVGYYSDGQEHVAFAVLSASGRRLFIEYRPDNVLTTNVGSYMFEAPV